MRLPGYLSIAKHLAGLLDRPTTLQQSRALVRQRVQSRDGLFLAFVERYVYGHPQSPYLPLLRHAGCTFMDLTALVRQRGVDGALTRLRDEGVYFSFEEFKGRVDMVRNGLSRRVRERDFDNPFAGPGLAGQTGGTRSAGSPVSVSLNFLAETYAPGMHAALEAAGAVELPVLIWAPPLTAIRQWFVFTFMGRPPLRCLSLAPAGDPTAVGRRRPLVVFARVMALRRGRVLPNPEVRTVTPPEKMLEILLAARRRHRGCVLLTVPSAAVRLATAARHQGRSLEDVVFLAVGEPLTAGKAGEIRRVGARAVPFYAFTEAGMVGAPCGRPAAVDETHLRSDAFAMIQRRREIPGIGEVDAYMFTTLAAAPPKIMLNVEMDDFGEAEVRRCGCVLDDLGLDTHLSSIRSFTKLTGEGAAVPGAECVRILEEVFPREFGGQSIDYQLLEQEDGEHVTRLFLLISPDVGPVDERRVLDRFAEELRRGSLGGQQLWRAADSMRVLRRRPILTPMGKLLPLHTQAMPPADPMA